MADQFQKDLELEVDYMIDGVNKAIVNSMLYGWNLVTAATPVDTGRARGSWLLTVDNLGGETLDYAKPQRSAGGEKIQIYPNPSAPDTPVFDVERNSSLFLSNAVNYIEFLEYGTDKISAFGMVTGALPKVANKMQRELNKLDRKS